MTTILCPTDFSKNATNSIEFACSFADKLNADVIIFNAYETPADLARGQFSIILGTESLIKESTEKKLATLRQKMLKKFPTVSIKSSIANGAGHTQTIAAAKKLKADLIIMGTTGTSKLGRLLMGSTTSRVIQKASCPVLCIPAETKFTGIKKIVFATDLNDDNIASATKIAPLAMDFNAEIIFVFVDDKHLIHAESEIIRMTQKIRKQIKYPKISGFISKNISITKGIDYFLKKYPADLLVMFTHHKHFPESLFNQSLTKLMSHQTNIPLLSLQSKD